MIGPFRSGAAASVVTLAEAKLHARVDGDDDDTLIDLLVSAATEQVAGMTGLVLGPESWTLQVGPQTGALTIPLAPVTALTEISYLDAAGELQTADVADFILYADAARPTIQPAEGLAWPDCADREDAIRVTVAAGYATTPPGLRAAILLMVGHLYANRETVVIGAAPAELPMTVVALVEAFKRQWVAA